MKALTLFSLGIIILLKPLAAQPSMLNDDGQKVDKTLFIYGNGMEKEFIQYVADLTKKSKPVVCFIPTAAADHPGVIQYIQSLASTLDVQALILSTFISSSPEQQSFEEIIRQSDAIIVGGGNTLNMLGIWKAQGIDTLLRQAYDRGVILAGGSAGSLCWFTGGYTDSRPKELTLMNCLGFLSYSHSPHYNKGNRRELYLEAVKSGKLPAGYACDDGAGLLFINGEMNQALTLNSNSNSYFVSLINGEIQEIKLKSKLIQ
jgi:dipeptidase E